MPEKLTAVVIVAVSLSLTACAPSPETASPLFTTETMQSSCDTTGSGFELASAEVDIANSGTKSITWTTTGTAPSGQQVTYGVAGGGNSLLIRMTNGTVDEVSMFDGSQNSYMDAVPDLNGSAVSFLIPPTISPGFDSAWMADLSVDGSRLSTCSHLV